MQKNISITDKYFISAKLIDHFENFDITVFFFSSKSFKISWYTFKEMSESKCKEGVKSSFLYTK